MQLAAQHELRYFVTGGTLLGAVRHKGFIPWDDDIDVAMPRPDFERLAALMRREPTADYTWGDLHTTSDYPFAWAKLGLAGTQYLEDRTERLSMPHTVAIDIFQFDGVPSNRVVRVLHHVACRVLQVRIASGARRPRIRAAIVRLLTILPRSWAVWSYERVVSAVPYDRSRLIANVAGLSGYNRNVVPRAWFGQVTYLQFESLRVAAPAMWHEYLRRLYDDYMRLPPESEQRSPHEARWDLGTYAKEENGLEAASPTGSEPARRR